MWTSIVGALLLSCGGGGGDRTASGKAFQVRFVDVTRESGITIKTTSGRERKRYIIEAKGGGAAAFLDYNNDGWMDIYIVNGSTLEGSPEGKEPRNILYRNNGDGTFTDVTEEAGVGDTGWGMGCTAVDYDNDGYTDIYVANFGPNRLYHNDGDGTFTDVTRKAGVGDPRWSTGTAWGDYDGDGYLDLYVANYVRFDMNNLEMYRKINVWRGIEVFAGPRGLPGEEDVLYHNDGDGTFTDVTRKAGVVDRLKGYGFTVLFADYDDDGDLDIYVANDSVPNYLYRNNGDGTFTEVGLEAGVAYSEDGREQAGMGAVFGDYDNDGDLDLFVTNFSDDNNTLYRNDGNGFFTDVTFQSGLGAPSLPFVSWGTEFFDYDNDGWKDLFVATGHVYPQVDQYNFGMTYEERNQLYHNDHDGTFTEVTDVAGPGMQIKKVSRGAIFGDYDNDGDIDVLVLNMGDRPTLLRNEGGNRNHWIKFRTVGTRSNRDGIGARIWVTAGGLTQMREVYMGSSFLCGNDIRVHFGLGKAEKAELVRIRWPSGLVEEFRDLRADRLYILKEGEGIYRVVKFGRTV
ncbi:MAG TPA: CRTAC1 family protein [Candidatus Latescibacteria bacterium]|nr:CRTAC1 family protein [Candidatus Latescibacterota bacterium]